MLKLFKKKKSDNKLSKTMLQEQRSFEFAGTSITNVPVKKTVSLLPPNIPESAARSSTPPSIIMPKPRRLLTPTREILGRFDNDKTLVEEEPERPPPDIISPILLPTPHHEEDQFLHKVIAALPKNSALYKVGSISTAASDDSSRIYESALESLADDDDDKISLDLPSLSFLKKQTIDDYNISDISSGTTNSQRKQLRVAAQSPTPSNTVTPTYGNINTNAVRKFDASNNRDTCQAKHVEHIKQFEQEEVTKQSQNDKQAQRIRPNPNNGLGPDDEQNQKKNQNQSDGQTQNSEQKQGYMQILNNENNRDTRRSQATRQHISQDSSTDLNLLREMQESKYAELQKKVEMMEKQFVLDREQFSKMEDELIHNRHEMMQTLIDTKDQLNIVLKAREETKMKEIDYQKRMKQQQLYQLQEVVLQHTQDEIEHSDEELYEDEKSSDSGYYPQQQKAQQPLEEQQDFSSYRRMARSKSQEYFKYNSRSSSASVQNSQYYIHKDEDRRSLSRRNSSTSNRSNMLDPSPSNTLIGNQFPHQRRLNRPRARSIETGRWQEEQHHYDEADIPEFHPRPRRSRSAGRRPKSRGSTIFYEDMQNEDVYYTNPRYYNQQDLYSDNFYRQPQTPQQYYYNQYHPQQAPSFRQALLRYPSNVTRLYSHYHHQQ